MRVPWPLSGHFPFALAAALSFCLLFPRPGLATGDVAPSGPELPVIAPGTPPESSGNDEEWITMPDSGRPTYVGIHGGTAPITIYSSPDGKKLALPGASGKDFLEVIRSGKAAPLKTNIPPGGPASFDWDAFSSRRAPLPAGLAPLSPQEWLLAESRRLEHEARERERHIAAIMALKPLQRIYPNREKPVFADMGPQPSIVERLQKKLGHPLP